MEKHPSKIHLIAGVSTATARLNILDCDGYGMMNFFENRCRLGQYQNRDCLYVRTLTGEKIVLVSGGGKAGDERLVKGKSIALTYAYENFCEMYEAYHKLGGNGMITKMKEEIEELHLGKAGAGKENK